MSELLGEIERRHAVRAADGLQIVAPDTMAKRPFDPGMALLILPASDGTSDGTAAPVVEGFDPAVLPGRAAHGSDPLTLLRHLYPAEHPVLALGDAADATLATLEPGRLGREPLLLPALSAVDTWASPHGLPWLAARLRAPDGCPWDREQDHLTLRKFLIEETYEVYDALENGSTPQLAEELGDLLLQIVLHAQYGAEAGVFDLTDVYRSIIAKIVRRHPHVFGDVEADTAAEVIRNWENIKATERADAPAKPIERDMPAAFAGLSKALPALAYANEMQERAASLGYDWPDLEGVIDKIEEEAVELLSATDQRGRNEEFGDLLFVVVNLGRKLAIDPEASLRAASRKFAARFAKVERFALADEVELRALGLDELDALWQRAKAQEREESAAADAMAGSATGSAA